MSKIMVEPHSRKDIELCATRMRQRFGIENKMYIDILKIVELIIPQIDESFKFVVVPIKDMPDNKYAEYRPKTNELAVREDVYEAACYENKRHRFTIAHELGHYFLHSNVSLARCPDNVEIPKYRDPEWQADVFASAFLIGRHLIYGMHPKTVSTYFGVSKQAAEIAVTTAKRAR